MVVVLVFREGEAGGGGEGRGGGGGGGEGGEGGGEGARHKKTESTLLDTAQIAPSWEGASRSAVHTLH